MQQIKKDNSTKKFLTIMEQVQNDIMYILKQI